MVRLLPRVGVSVYVCVCTFQNFPENRDDKARGSQEERHVLRDPTRIVGGSFALERSRPQARANRARTSGPRPIVCTRKAISRVCSTMGRALMKRDGPARSHVRSYGVRRTSDAASSTMMTVQLTFGRLATGFRVVTSRF